MNEHASHNGWLYLMIGYALTGIGQVIRPNVVNTQVIAENLGLDATGVGLGVGFILVTMAMLAYVFKPTDHWFRIASLPFGVWLCYTAVAITARPTSSLSTVGITAFAFMMLNVYITTVGSAQAHERIAHQLAEENRGLKAQLAALAAAKSEG